MVHGLSLADSPDKFCEGCVIGKHPRSSFPKVAEYRAKNPLELVHTDIYSPIKPSSISENRYFITFIDNLSRKTLVYFLKEKSEVFEVFKKFKVFIEKQSGFYIKVLRSDRGGEFTSTVFNSFFVKNMIFGVT
jgi:Integrase core domain